MLLRHQLYDFFWTGVRELFSSLIIAGCARLIGRSMQWVIHFLTKASIIQELSPSGPLENLILSGQKKSNHLRLSSQKWIDPSD